MSDKKPTSIIKKNWLYAKNTTLLVGSVANYWSYYFGNRRFPKDQEFYVVYTSLDHAVPFQPNSAGEYWSVNFNFVPAILEMGNILPPDKFKQILRTYVEFAREGAVAFQAVPTIMPHFTEHDRQALKATQTLLKPINCSPSLHTAVPFFAYNLGLNYIPEKEPELRRYVGNIISTVIKTKLHAMVDVAFGMALCKQIVERKMDLDFCDLETFFLGERKEKDKIPYEHIYRMYHEINAFEKTTDAGLDRFPELMKRYFSELGLPRVRREQSDCYYDFERKTLATAPSLKIGKGLL